ncbi:hypothetical protein [Corynebacterium sp. NML 120412]|nr:hypothetical protein [Corynebacterium sp. NML 120412]MDL0401622.1 hypothetical protein [Corynebacterium lehmanniae]
MQLKPTVQRTDGVFGDTQSIGSGYRAHALLEKLNQLLALPLT